MAPSLIVYTTSNSYRPIPVDLSGSISPQSLDPAMVSVKDGVADSSYAYSTHGTPSDVLGRLDAFGASSILTIPTSQSITLDSTYVWGASTDGATGTLWRVAKSTFDAYEEWSVDAGAESGFGDLSDELAVDGNGDIWLHTRQGSPFSFGSLPNRPQLTRFQVSSQSWGPTYTLLSAPFTAGKLQIEGTTAYWVGRPGGAGNAVLYKINLNDGTTSGSLTLSGTPDIGNVYDLLVLGAHVFILGESVGVIRLVKVNTATLTIDSSLDVAADGIYSKLTTDGVDRIFTSGGTIGRGDLRLITASSNSLTATLSIGSVSTDCILTTYFQGPASDWGVDVINW